MDKYEDMASQIAAAQKKIHNTVLNRNQSELAFQTWSEACTQFHKLYERLHTSYQLYPNEILLKQGNANAIQIALNYLFADPYYFGSGYHKECLVSILKRLILANKALFSSQQLQQVEAILLRKVKSGYRREFRYYCRLAKVLSSDKLKAELKIISNSNDIGASRRAHWMLDYLF